MAIRRQAGGRWLEAWLSGQFCWDQDRPWLADITYSVNRTVGLGSVVGTITTDGDIGTLGLGDFVAWSLTLNGVGAVYAINNTDSTVWGAPDGDVTATATDLYFNFGGSEGDLIFQQVVSSGAQYYCDQAVGGACLNGESDVPQYYTNASAQIVSRTENQIIGSVGGSIPEPSTWALMLLGFGGIGYAGYRQTRRMARVAPIG
jgi:hypothetical protein